MNVQQLVSDAQNAIQEEIRKQDKLLNKIGMQFGSITAMRPMNEPCHFIASVNIEVKPENGSE